MAMESPTELFVHDLSDMYDAENKIAKMLEMLSGEASNTQVKAAFDEHLAETRQQISNLDQVFSALGQKPSNVDCDAIAGLEKEHKSFMKEKPSEAILAMFDLGAASKTEYYEMASYAGLIEKANLMGQPQIVTLLQQNYEQERAMAERVSQLSQQLGQQSVGMMGQLNTGAAQTGGETVINIG